MADDDVPGPVVVATLATLLLQALERPDAEHLADDRLKAALRAVNARAEDAIGDVYSPTRLHLVKP